MAWLRVGQASWVFWCLGVVIAVAAPGLLGHLPSISDLGVNTIYAVFVVSFIKRLTTPASTAWSGSKNPTKPSTRRGY